MPIWTVHGKTADPALARARAEDVRFVPEGFNWPAFLVPLLWLILKGMWIVLGLSIAFELAVMAVGQSLKLSGLVQTTLSLTLNLIMGFAGNDLYRWTLSRRGCREIGLAAGSDLDEAELRYFMGLPNSPDLTSTQAPVALAPRAAPIHDALGLFPHPRVSR